jgi:hypothetical protein
MCFAEQQRSRSVCINKAALINNLQEICWILVDIFEDVLYILRSMNYSNPSSTRCSRAQTVSSQPPNFTFLFKRKRTRTVGILRWGVVSPQIKSKLENRPLSTAHELLAQYIHSYCPYLVTYKMTAKWLERCLLRILSGAAKILMKLSLFSRTQGWWFIIGHDGFLPDSYKITEYDHLFTSYVTK